MICVCIAASPGYACAPLEESSRSRRGGAYRTLLIALDLLRRADRTVPYRRPYEWNVLNCHVFPLPHWKGRKQWLLWLGMRATLESS